MHRSEYKVERRDGTGYRAVSPSEALRMLDAGTIRLEGADGDEEKNLVTYYYTRDMEGRC